jgi:NitT/TauT family transport system substrate-binding protein
MFVGVARVWRGSLCLALTAVLCLAVAACGDDEESSSGAGTGTTTSASSKPVTLRVGYNPNPTNTTIHVAIQQGFFKENGLDVKLTPLQAAAAQLPALGKQFDLLTTTSVDVLRGYANGLKTVVVQGQTMERPGLESTGFMAGKGIDAITDLKGKRIGVPSLAGSLYIATIIQLEKAGIKQNQVKFVQVPFPNMLDQLKANRIQAAVTIVPFANVIQGAGFKKLPNPLLQTTGGKQTMTAGWAANEDWAKSNAETLAKFRKAQQEAADWIKANDQAARQILVKDFHMPEIAAKNYPISDFTEFDVDPASFEPWVTEMESVGLLRKGAITDPGVVVQTQ